MVDGQREPGRFIQQDPIGDGMNWYAYVGNNPLRWVDPSGYDYGNVSVYVPGVIVGIHLGPDPCAAQTPWKWYAASTWRNVHPYIGPGIGFPGVSATLAPDWPYEQTPGHGWYGIVTGGYVVGGSWGGRLTGELGSFWEVGAMTPGVWSGAYYEW